jgi:hypothetical protein
MGSMFGGKTRKVQPGIKEARTRAPLGAKMASQYMLRLTVPCDQVAQAELRLCSGMLTLGSS